MLILNILTVVDLLQQNDLIPFDYSIEEGYLIFFDYGYNIEIVLDSSELVTVIARGEHNAKSEFQLDYNGLSRFLRRRHWLAVNAVRQNSTLAQIIRIPEKS